MIYACEKCGFIFSRTGGAESCPSCGRPEIREANERERAQYVKLTSSSAKAFKPLRSDKN
jgi:uncharacterized Zn finger protein (UPF0148 family)